MILILSNVSDYSTNIVIDWLNFYKINWIRINENDYAELEFYKTDIKFQYNSFSFLFSEIEGVWYRRGKLNFKLNDNLFDEPNIDNFRKVELEKIKQLIYYKLSKLPHINRFEASDVNKLIVNDLARFYNLKTPKEYIVSNKETLNNLLDENNDFCTKSISGSGFISSEKFYIELLTKKIHKKDKFSTNFFPSLVQSYIDKKFELRIFFIERNFWTMAIFSQNDPSTKIDFRNYNHDFPNRNVPFNLPNKIKSKLIKLMNRINLNSGSIDMIYTKNNDYVFLEVNPVGQFGMVSNPCNYNLHKEIAKYFKENIYERN